MLRKFNEFLDANPWACFVGIALCLVIVGAIERASFPV